MATLIGFKRSCEPAVEAMVDMASNEDRGKHNVAFQDDERHLEARSQARNKEKINSRQPPLTVASDLLTNGATGDEESSAPGGQHFKIEWANLRLEMEAKWYQKLQVMSGLNKNRDDGARPKFLLNGVHGQLKSGELTAILGPSGAGKTSLLNSLFGKYRQVVNGTIKVSGAPSKKHLSVCFIPQSDHLIDQLTTEEALWFASRLNNSMKFGRFDHNDNIERVIDALGLQSCRHTRINKLSGGQHKRVSIAQEMLTSPDVLVLDEPTSGLDSLTCYKTIKVLRDLVEAKSSEDNMRMKHGQHVRPMSIVLTIHQPPLEVLQWFHSVYVMALGGRTLFQGSPREMEQILNGGAQWTRQILAHVGQNPASLMIELASGQFGQEPLEAMLTIQQKRFEASLETYHHHDQQIDPRIMTPTDGRANMSGSYWRSMSLITRRCFLASRRDLLFLLMRVGIYIIIPVTYAYSFGTKVGIPNACPSYQPEFNLLEYVTGEEQLDETIQEGHNVAREQFQNISLHFLLCWSFVICTLAHAAISFPLMMPVLIKEIRNGWYSLSVFLVGKTLAELPFNLLLPPLAVAINYWMTNQPSSHLHWRYLVQSLLLMLIIIIGEAKGMIFGAILMDSLPASVILGSLSTTPPVIVSDFYIRLREIPTSMQYLSSLSYVKHYTYSLIISRYGFQMCQCNSSLIPTDGIPRIVGFPDSIVKLTDYYVNSYIESKKEDEMEAMLAGTTGPTMEPTMETTAAINSSSYQPETQGLLFNKLASLLSKSKAFGYTIKQCSDVESFALKDMLLRDDMLVTLICKLLLSIIVLKLIGYLVIGKCIQRKL